MPFNNYPYTNLNDLNLDYLLKNESDIKKMIREEAGSLVADAAYDNGTIILVDGDNPSDGGTFTKIQIEDNEYTVSDPNVALLAADLADLAETIPPQRLDNAKFLLIGNSYMRGTGGTIGQGWGFYFQSKTGASCRYIQQAGGDFATVGNSNADYPNATIAQALGYYAASMTEDERNEINYLIFGGGYNDHNESAADIEAGVLSFIQTALANFPNAKIWIIPLICPHTWSDDIALYFNAERDAVIKYGSKNVGFNGHSWEWMYGKTSYGAGDDIHCNDNGYEWLAECIAAVVNGWDGKFDSKLGGSSDITLKSNWTATAQPVAAFRQGNVLMLRITATCLGSNIVNAEEIAQLTADYRPNYTYYFPAFLYAGDFSARREVILEYTGTGLLRVRAVIGGALTGGTTYTLYCNACIALFVHS